MPPSLSASLHEATENDSYRFSAEMAASFIKTQLYNGTFVGQDIELKNCFISEGIYSHATGAFIEGLSVLAQNNLSWIPLCDYHSDFLFRANFVISVCAKLFWALSHGLTGHMTRVG